MYYKNKIHKTTKVMASLRILNIILKRFQSCFIHILANPARAKFEVKNKSFRALSRIFFQKLNMSVQGSNIIVVKCTVVQPQTVSYVQVRLERPIEEPYIVAPTNHRKALLSNVYGEGNLIT